ncbi:MAG: SDR family NAD(P)-dependent oxidoreductase, partial [Microcoleaceae cyanobacterium]
ASLPRYRMQPEGEPLPQQPFSQILKSPQGLFLITEDQLGVAPYVATALQQAGATPVILSPDILLNPKRLAHEVDQLRETWGPVTGIVHLAALAPLSLPNSFPQWRTYTTIQAKSLFQLLHLCSQERNSAKTLSYVLSASLLGGYLGRPSDSSSPNHSQDLAQGGLATGGAAVGLLKTLSLEQPEVQVKAVDFDQTLSGEAMAQHIVQELFLPGGRIEVGYPQGDRTVFRTVSAPITPEPITPETTVTLSPEPDWVVLVTGGAKGITAETVLTLATVGLTLVIVGRSACPEEDAIQTQGIEDIAALRRVLLDRAKAQGVLPTPVQVEGQIKQILGDRAIRANLKRFQQAGATVEYLPGDVKNPIEFQHLVNDIYSRYGRLDAVIHGAGIIEDKLIQDKTLDSFERVFDTKVDSTFILSQCLRPESLKLLVLFSSVAGRYGNKGQSDYAAANEVVNRLAWQLDQRWPQTRVVAINWGPWDTTGMASEDVKRQFREQGVIPIPLDSGCEFFLEELLWGQKGDVEMIAGMGPWDAHEQKMAHCPSVATLAFLGKTAPQLQPDGTVTLDHTFSLGHDPYLADHCLDGQPVVPAAVALEWLAEFIQAAWPEWELAQIQNLRVLRGLVLPQAEGCSVRLQAKASTHADAESLTVTAEILDPVRRTLYYRATARLQPQLHPSPPLLDLNPIGGQSLPPEEAYRNYLFHGKRFQLITAIAGCEAEGIDAQVQPSYPTTWLTDQTPGGYWLFDPGMIDTAPQLAIIWARMQRDTTVLPARFGCVTRYAASRSPQPLQVALRVTQANEYSLSYDALFFDAHGNIHFQLQDMEGTCNSQLNRLAQV